MVQNIAAGLAKLSGWEGINDGVLMYKNNQLGKTELIRMVDWNRYASWHMT